MSIIPSELQAYLSASISDDDPAANGGPIADAPMPLSALNNAFPNVTLQERTQGDRKWRKIYLVNANADQDGVSPMVVMDKPTAYGDYAYFVPGAGADYESDLTGSEAMYGAALFATDVQAGATQIVLALEHEDMAPMLAVGRELLISNRSAFDNTTSTQGHENLRHIADVTVSGTTATVTLDAGLEHNFTVASGARASVVWRPDTMKPSTGNATPLWVSAVIPPGTTEYGLTDIPIGWQVESLL